VAENNALEVVIPPNILPSDGRFGSGPSKVRPEAVEALAGEGSRLLGTSHRQAPVRAVVRHVKEGVGQLFGLPEGYEVVLGNGGASAFWDAATFCLIARQSQHLSFGEFSSKFAAAAAAAPWLEPPEVLASPLGSRRQAIGRPGPDLYALTHNETSTGVMTEIRRPAGADVGALVAVDATSAAAGLRFDARETDVYYFAPQKGFGSDGGLWVAAFSPAAIERAQEVKAGGRFVPAFLDLTIAIDNSRLDQTYNTPALATLVLMASQLDWFLDNGGLEFSCGRCDASAEILYGWADKSDYATPFVAEPEARSHVVGTIDLDEQVDAAAVAKVLRANGVLDTEPYRKLGRNQLRVAMFPAVEPSDVEALVQCIDYVVGALS